MTKPARKKAGRVRKPRECWWATSTKLLPPYLGGPRNEGVEIPGGAFSLHEVREIYAWLGKWLEWRQQQLKSGGRKRG